MQDVSRRGAFKVWSGVCASMVAPRAIEAAVVTAPSGPFHNLANESGVIRARVLLREAAYEDLWEKLTKEHFAEYFSSLDVEHFDGALLTTSVTSKFHRNWISEHYIDGVLSAAQSIDPSVKDVRVAWRRHQSQRPRQLEFWRHRSDNELISLLNT